MTTTDPFVDQVSIYSSEEQKRMFDELEFIARNFSKNLEAIPSAEIPQADGSAVEEVDKFRQEFDQSKVEFSQVLEVYPLAAENIGQPGVPLPTQMEKVLRKNKFCLINVPVTLMAARGWAFYDLDCMVEFNPGADALLRPVAYEIFPKSEFETVISASQGLEVGLDENLSFKPWTELQKVFKAKINSSAEGKAHLALGPYEYAIRRPKIVSRGLGSPKVLWQLHGEEPTNREYLKLAIVLKIPRKVKKVNVTGILRASCHFHTFTAQIRYLTKLLTGNSRRFFEQGAPICRECTWDISTQI